jgi:hypothetical protein
MLYFLIGIFFILLILLTVKKYNNLLFALLPSYLHLLVGLFFPIPTLAYNLLWMLGPTLGSFFLARAFKVNLKPVFIFALIAGILLTQVTNQIALLLLYAGFNYLIQFGILLWNIKIKWTVEQGLFGIFCLGGIGSLIMVLAFSYQAVEICLVFYYCVLIICSIVGNKINSFRNRNIE